MDADEIRRWREADRLFTGWLDQAETDRDRWLLAQNLAAELLQAVEQLIEAHHVAETGFPVLEHMAGADEGQPVARNQLAGRQIGDWLLMEEIGRGGMSVVYKARRIAVDFEQLAAVKLLGLAVLGREGSQRFEQERRLLARLRHPGIAALIDGGIADDGTPFLVMNLIEGETLARYCQQHSLNWSSCVQLMVKVCDAVAHAHQNLMVHRDLKPGNIMVASNGDPVLLDFGIAKLLDQDVQQTHTQSRALTPGYAAPEQFDGGAITTATDVYALGVTLKALCRPAKELPRDLHNIIAMALRPEAGRRYPDARALGEDLRRLLDRRAVMATPDSAGYRLRAFLRRHRGLAYAVSATALALLIGLGSALWQAQRASLQANEAQRQAARATAARDFLFAMITAGDRERNEVVDPPVSEVIARGIVELEDTPLGDPALHAEVATLLAQMDTSLGQHERAGKLFDSAMRSAEQTHDVELLANVRIGQGLLANARGQPEQAIALFEIALAEAATLAGVERERVRVTALSGWTYAMENLGRGQEAQTRLAKTLEDTGNVLSARQRNELILMQTIVTPDPSQRMALLSRVQEGHREHPATPGDRLFLASMMAAAAIQLGQLDEAVRYAQQASVLAERVHPGNTNRRARIYNNLGTALSAANRMAEADAAYATAEAIYRALGDLHSPAFAALVHNRGVLLRDLGVAESAVPLIAQASAMAAAQFGQQDRRSLIALRNLAMARAEAGDNAQAEQDWQLALQSLPSAATAQDRYNLFMIGAHVAALAGRADRAQLRLDEVDAVTLSTPEVAAVAQRMRRDTIAASVLSLNAKQNEASRMFARVASGTDLTEAGVWSATWRHHLAFAEHLARNGDAQSARAQYAKTLSLLEERGSGIQSRLHTRLRGSIESQGDQERARH